MPASWTVVSLVEGSTYSSSSTFLTDGATRVVIDTGLSLESRDLARALAARGIDPNGVDLVINTHLHVDHCGNNRLFRRARVVVSRAEWDWTHAFYAAIFNASAPEQVASQFYPELADHGLSPRTIRSVTRMARLFWKPEQIGDRDRLDWIEDIRLPDGLDVLPTPGHTPHHVSIRVASDPVVIVAGDAVLHEHADAKIRTMIPYSQDEFLRTRDALLHLGTRIIPGHGPAFDPQPASIGSGRAR